MDPTRRRFLHSGVSLTLASAAASAAQPVQVPKVKFRNVEIGRLVLGSNPLYGYAHFNNNLSRSMAEYNTPERVSAVMHQCASHGINAFNYVHNGRSLQDLRRFESEGGRMHIISQVRGEGAAEAEMLVRTLKPLGLQRQGEIVDTAFQTGQMDTVREWCKKVRDMGVAVGVGTHIPEVIATIEEENWDVDFYSGCVYNRRRTAEERKKILGGQEIEMPNELYLKGDPPRMYRVMRQTKKPCFAFKILAAGRIRDTAAVQQAFRTAFESIKPTDAVYVGMYPRFKDEVRENAEIVHRIFAKT
jgi:hypothetical protein